MLAEYEYLRAGRSLSKEVTVIACGIHRTLLPKRYYYYYCACVQLKLFQTHTYDRWI